MVLTLSGLIDTIERYGFPPETKNAFQEGRNVNIGSIPVVEIELLILDLQGGASAGPSVISRCEL